MGRRRPRSPARPHRGVEGRERDGPPSFRSSTAGRSCRMRPAPGLRSAFLLTSLFVVNPLLRRRLRTCRGFREALVIGGTGSPCLTGRVPPNVADYVAKDIRDFLMTRRARIAPDQVGLPPGRRRRVPGLRREEVAQLAGVSTEYYTQIERGNVGGVSDDVLHAVTRALRFSEDETTHFFDLVRAVIGTRTVSRAKRGAGQPIPDGVQGMIDNLGTSPAIVMNGSLDILAANRLGRALYGPVFDRATGVPNLARFIFFDSYADQG